MLAYPLNNYVYILKNIAARKGNFFIGYQENNPIKVPNNLTALNASYQFLENEVYDDIMSLAETDDDIRPYTSFADIEDILLGCLYDIRINSIAEMALEKNKTEKNSINKAQHSAPSGIEQIIELRNQIINNILMYNMQNHTLVEDIKKHVNRETLTTLALTTKPGQKNNHLHKTIHYLHLFKEIKQIHEEKKSARQCNDVQNINNENHLLTDRKACLAFLHEEFLTNEYLNHLGTERKNLENKANFCHNNTTSLFSKTGLHSRLARDINTLGNSNTENEPQNYLSYQKIEKRFGNKGKKTHNEHYYDPSLTCHQIDGKKIEQWKASKTVATQLGLEKFYKQQRFDLINLIDDFTEITDLPYSLENLTTENEEIDDAVNALQQIKKNHSNDEEILTLAQNMEDALRSYHAIYRLRINKNDDDNQLSNKSMAFTHNSHHINPLSVNPPETQPNSYQAEQKCIIL